MTFVCVAVFCYLAVCVSAEAPLKWPEKYAAEGSISLPYAEISEPFRAVVDMSKEMSLMSTYNGKCTIKCTIVLH